MRATQHPFPADLSRNDRKETLGESAKREKTWALDPIKQNPYHPTAMKTLPPNGLIIEENPAIAAAIHDYHRCGGAHFWTVYSPHNSRYTGIIASATD